MNRGWPTRVELQTAAQGLPKAPLQLPQSPVCERCVCCRPSGSCHGKCIQKQPKQTGLVSATLHSGNRGSTFRVSKISTVEVVKLPGRDKHKAAPGSEDGECEAGFRHRSSDKF